MKVTSVYLGVVPFLAAATDPTATVWPDEFIINFDTNITTTPEATTYPVKGISYYDWTIKAQRIEHAAGAYECTYFYNTDLRCTLYFLSDGLYRILQQPLPEGVEEECCLDMPGIGPSAPDWASATHPSYNGIVYDGYSSMETAKWTFDTLPNTDQPHMYHEVAPGSKYEGNPVLFTFPAVEGRQDYHYDPESMQVGPINDSVFQLPQGCAGKLCTSDSKRTTKRLEK